MDPQITCPHCKTNIKLTESLAEPLLAKTRLDFEAKLNEQTAAITAREEELRSRQSQLAHAQASLEAQVSERLDAERKELVARESKRARSTVEFEMQQKEGELKALQDTLKSREIKLKEAQAQQAEYLQKQRELEDQTRELDLTIQKRTQANLEAVRAKAKAEAEESLRLKVSEKEELIAGMQRKIEDLQRRAEQGSQQLQGEVLELELEQLLANHFPHDKIEPVAKGEMGADILHRVLTRSGEHTGTIIWELKRTRNWSDGWLAKLREDQRNSNAEIAILVSQVLPKNTETLDLLDGVHVVHPRALLPLAMILRQSLIQLATAKSAQQGRSSKTEQMYAYLTGPRFRHRVEAIVEKFTDMQDDLNRERKVMQKQWAKREAQIHSIIEATTGLVGDVQGIAGRAMPEIPSLDLPVLAFDDSEFNEEHG